MVKLNQIKRLSLAAVAALAVTAVTGLAVWASTPCTTPTPDCPEVNCDK
ncbi:porin [Fortiea sp. LEGE XX443]|nr:porin [Fortiea sp. LEGE XX443]MBE9003827.1 porin [Fortiea sp. LEGE XX443]